MTEDDIQQLRREKWHAGSPLSTLEEARDFVASVGLCLLYPMQPAVLLPTFLGAWLGADHNVPGARQAFAEPRARQAEQIVDQLAAGREVFLSNLLADNVVLVSPTVFPYFCALACDKTPATGQPLSRMAQQALAAMVEPSPITAEPLRTHLGAELSTAAIERALIELWTHMRVLPVGRDAQGARLWQVTERWAPDALREAQQISMPAAISGLVSQYLEAVVAADPVQVEELFGHLAPRSKIKDAVNAMLGAREFSLLNIGHHSLVQVTPERIPHQERQDARPRRGATKPDKQQEA